MRASLRSESGLRSNLLQRLGAALALTCALAAAALFTTDLDAHQYGGPLYVSPSKPLFPTSRAECSGLEAAWQRIRSDIGRQHQACLDKAAGSRCPIDSASGCTCRRVQRDTERSASLFDVVELETEICGNRNDELADAQRPQRLVILDQSVNLEKGAQCRTFRSSAARSSAGSVMAPSVLRWGLPALPTVAPAKSSP